MTNFNPPDLTKNFLEGDNRYNVLKKLQQGSEDIYVLGTNSWAKSLDKNFDISGFIDDFTTDKIFLNKDILNINDINPSSIFISSNVLGRPLTAFKRLLDYSENCLDYYTLLKEYPNTLNSVLWIEDFREEYLKNDEFYSALSKNLADDYSRYTLNKLINFRLTFDLAWMQGFTDCQHRQYFEPFLNLKDMKCFYDIGCYDGFTSHQFMLNCPNYQMVEIFEPSPNNIMNIKKNLKDFKKFRINEFCAANINGFLRFNEGGSSSNITADGAIKVEARKLDDLELHRPSFIKMDIEGGEMDALRGMKETIKKNKPVIASSVYHKVDDIRKIYLFVMDINPDYKVYLRHYTEGITETVMFFV